MCGCMAADQSPWPWAWAVFSRRLKAASAVIGLQMYSYRICGFFRVFFSPCAESARWLVKFANHPATHWDGLCLSSAIVASKRQSVRRGEASIVDLRNYLFSCQCHVLLQLRRPAEICQRSVPFIHNCIKELRILKVGCLTFSSSSCFRNLQNTIRFTRLGWLCQCLTE